MKTFATTIALCVPMLLAGSALANGPRTPREALRMSRARLGHKKFVAPQHHEERFEPVRFQYKGRTMTLGEHIDAMLRQTREPMPKDVAHEMHTTSTSKTKVAHEQKHSAKDNEPSTSLSHALVPTQTHTQTHTQAQSQTDELSRELTHSPTHTVNQHTVNQHTAQPGFFSRLVSEMFGL